MPKSRKTEVTSLAKLLRGWLLATLAYLILGALLPANKQAMQNYNLGSVQYHILIFIVVLPYVLIWLAAFYGYAKLSQYSSIIAGTSEGAAFKKLARGSHWLAWSLAVPAIVSIILNSIADNHHGFLPAALIISNYISLILPLIAFTLICKGAQELTADAKIKLTSQNAQVILVTFIVLGFLFCFFMFRRLGVDSIGTVVPNYHLPVWLLILTLIIPYLYTWFCGLLAANELIRYGAQVPGLLYRQAMRLIAAGMVAVIASSVAAQCLRVIFPRSGHLSLSKTLLIINLFFILLAAGYVLISIGSHKLKKIEEV